MSDNYVQQTTSADVIFQMHFFLALYGLNPYSTNSFVPNGLDCTLPVSTDFDYALLVGLASKYVYIGLLYA